MTEVRMEIRVRRVCGTKLDLHKLAPSKVKKHDFDVKWLCPEHHMKIHKWIGEV